MQRIKSIRKDFQSGFTLVELAIVAAIIAILTIAALPQIQSYLIKGKTGPASNEVQRGLNSMRVNAEGNGSTPFTGVTTAVFANAMREGSVFTVEGTGNAATLRHSLAASGTSEVTVAPATIALAGDAFAITMSNTNRGACPDFATTMNKNSAIISVNGTQVKALGGRYDPVAATNACNTVDLDANEFIFVIQ